MARELSFTEGGGVSGWSGWGPLAQTALRTWDPKPGKMWILWRHGGKRGMLDDARTTKKEAFAILLAKVEECKQNAC